MERDQPPSQTGAGSPESRGSKVRRTEAKLIMSLYVTLFGFKDVLFLFSGFVTTTVQIYGCIGFTDEARRSRLALFDSRALHLHCSTARS